MALSAAWSSGDHYEPFMGRWSRLVAEDFVEWLDVEPGKRWLDVGSGTGALTEQIALLAAPSELIGVDPSPSFVQFAEARLGERARFTVASATQLPLDEDAVDVAVSGLVLNFVPDLVRTLAETARVVRVGGTAGAYLWDYRDGMHFLDIFWKTASEVDAAARDFYESTRFGGWGRARLEQLFSSIGSHVETREIDIPTVFPSFDDFWNPFLGGQGPAPSYLSSRNDTDRERLRDMLRERVPTAADGSIPLTARALAVRCTVL